MCMRDREGARERGSWRSGITCNASSEDAEGSKGGLVSFICGCGLHSAEFLISSTEK